MSEPVYGRLTPYELEKLGSGQYVEHGGRRVRITELVPRMDGGANYQAVEADPKEAVVDAVAQMADRFDEPPEATAPVPVSPGPDSGDMGAVAIAEDAYARAREEESVWQPPEFSPIKPVLAVWAKSNGWAGRGAIPKAVKARYAEQFGEG